MLNWTVTENKKREFEEHLLEHMNPLYNLAYSFTRNREEASDLLQEASLRAYRFYNKFEKGTNFKAWIMTIMRNIYINQYRKKVKTPTHVDYDEVENYITTTTPSMDGVAEEIFSEHVQKSIDKLPEELQTAMLLFYVDGFAYKEIAKIMECPIGTVMSRLHAARGVLKKQLAEIIKKEGVR